jgi:hypothetical protein
MKRYAFIALLIFTALNEPLSAKNPRGGDDAFVRLQIKVAATLAEASSSVIRTVAEALCAGQIGRAIRITGGTAVVTTIGMLALASPLLLWQGTKYLQTKLTKRPRRRNRRKPDST